MGLVIGTDIFGKVIESKLDFVDKSLFIKDVIFDKAGSVKKSFMDQVSSLKNKVGW